MSTTPEDSRPPAEGQPAEPPTATGSGPGKSRPKLLRIASGVVVLLVVVLVVLHFVNQSSERGRVYGEGRPLQELQDLKGAQQEFLDGDNPTGKSLEQAMAEALRK